MVSFYKCQVKPKMSLSNPQVSVGSVSRVQSVSIVQSVSSVQSSVQSVSSVQCMPSTDWNVTSRPHRNSAPPDKYSPEREVAKPRSKPKPYVLDRVKALGKKEETLDRPYTPEVTLKKQGNLVISFQGMVFEAFKQNVQVLTSKRGYSIVMPKDSNQVTMDGHADSNSPQVNINGRKAYIMNFYHTTCRVNVNGQKMKSAFVDEDFEFILNSISGSGITNRHIYLLTNAAREAIGRAKKSTGASLLEIEGSTPAAHAVQRHIQVPTPLVHSKQTDPLKKPPPITPPIQQPTYPCHNTTHSQWCALHLQWKSWLQSLLPAPIHLVLPPLVPPHVQQLHS